MSAALAILAGLGGFCVVALLIVLGMVFLPDPYRVDRDDDE